MRNLTDDQVTAIANAILTQIEALLVAKFLALK